jgi:hypothetical protein
MPGRGIYCTAVEAAVPYTVTMLGRCVVCINDANWGH